MRALGAASPMAAGLAGAAAGPRFRDLPEGKR